jgi:hypothetical protein
MNKEFDLLARALAKQNGVVLKEPPPTELEKAALRALQKPKPVETKPQSAPPKPQAWPEQMPERKRQPHFVRMEDPVYAEKYHELKDRGVPENMCRIRARNKQVQVLARLNKPTLPGDFKKNFATAIKVHLERMQNETYAKVYQKNLDAGESPSRARTQACYELKKEKARCGGKCSKCLKNDPAPGMRTCSRCIQKIYLYRNQEFERTTYKFKVEARDKSFELEVTSPTITKALMMLGKKMREEIRK